MIGREVAGRFRILAKLGEGGMGAVYRAEQMSLKRTVALKMLRPDVATGSTLLQRFNAEAHAVAKLSHPNTVNIFEFGQDTDGMLFIAMEFIEGKSLRTVIHNEAPLSVRRTLAIASQVCASIADAHSHSIVHRDLKPDNVMLQDRGRQKDVVRVLDFGIAKLRDDSRVNNAMTQAGDMLGTPQYMAPEQIRADQIDGRTDVYALGCMMYEMLTGRLPFEGPTVMALLSKHLTETPPPPSQRRPDLGLPPMIDDLVMAAMAKDRSQRPATMEQLQEHIDGILATLPRDNPSAPVSVPYMPAPHAPTPNSPTPNSPTPNAPSAYGAAPTAQPFVPAMPPPPGAAAYAPGGAPPGAYNPAPYATPHPTPPPPSHPTPAPFPTAPPAARPAPAKSNRTMLIVIGVVVLAAGAGVGGYFMTREKKQDAPAPDPDKPDHWDGDKPEKPDEPDKDPPDDEDPPDPPDPPEDEKKVDPWGGAGASSASSSGSLAGDTIDIGQGAKFVVPSGFISQTNADGVAVVDASRGIAFLFGPIEAGTDDARTLAKRYAKLSGLKLKTVSKEFIQGAQRAYAIFEGDLGGLQVRHAVIAFLSPSYRIAMVIHLPISLGADPSVQALVAEAATRRLQLP